MDDGHARAMATGAMLVGRRTWEVGDRMEAEVPGSTDYPFSGPTFLLTHRPLEPPDPEVRILAGDIGEPVATALDAAGGNPPLPRAQAVRPDSPIAPDTPPLPTGDLSATGSSGLWAGA